MRLKGAPAPLQQPLRLNLTITTRVVDRLPVVVESMASLMESELEDGEDSMIISNTYMSILCLVTSQTGALSFDTRKLVLQYHNLLHGWIWYPCKTVLRPASVAC